MNTQFRATCPACFAVQALRGDTLVQHGYRRPQHWQQNVGTCAGTGHAHFGTDAGRDTTASIAVQLREEALHVAARAVNVLTGAADVMVNKRVAVGVSMSVIKDNPTDRDRAEYAASLRRTVVAMLQQANELETKVAQWVAVAPLTRTVAKAKGPLVHWAGGYWASRGGRKACAASLMNATTGYGVTDLSRVTCDKCKSVAARQ